MPSTTRSRRLGDGLVPEEPPRDGAPEDGAPLSPEDGAPLPPEEGDVGEAPTLPAIIDTTSSRGVEAPEEDEELNELREQLRRKRREDEKAAIRAELAGEEPPQGLYASIDDATIPRRGHKRVASTYAERPRRTFKYKEPSTFKGTDVKELNEFEASFNIYFRADDSIVTDSDRIRHAATFLRGLAQEEYYNLIREVETETWTW